MRRKWGRIGEILRDGVVLCAFVIFGLLIAAKLDSQGTKRYSGAFRVVDGDTLSRQGERFRLEGIDAPELDQTCNRQGLVWRCGEEARALLRRIVASGSLSCDGKDRDRYGRLLVRCNVAGRDIAGDMVAQGMAVVTDYFLFAAQERTARAKALGLWAGTFDMPRDWRRMRNMAEADAPAVKLLSTVRRMIGWE